FLADLDTGNYGAQSCGEIAHKDSAQLLLNQVIEPAERIHLVHQQDQPHLATRMLDGAIPLQNVDDLAQVAIEFTVRVLVLSQAEIQETIQNLDLGRRQRRQFPQRMRDLIHQQMEELFPGSTFEVDIDGDKPELLVFHLL